MPKFCTSDLPQMLAFHWSMDWENLRVWVHIWCPLECARTNYLQTWQCLLYSPLFHTNTHIQTCIIISFSTNTQFTNINFLIKKLNSGAL